MMAQRMENSLYSRILELIHFKLHPFLFCPILLPAGPGTSNSEDTASAIQCLPAVNFLYSKANHSLIVEHLRGIVEYSRGIVEHLWGNKM